MGGEGPSDAQNWPEWCVRQNGPGGRACVFVLAPDAHAAVTIANHLVGPMGGWRVGRDVELEVFLRSEYPKHGDRGDFTRTVIDRPVRREWLEKRLRAEGELTDPTSAE